MRRLALILALLAAFTTRAKADSIAADLPIGTVYESSILVARTKVPLPPGKWTLVSLNEANNNDRHLIAHVALLNVVDGKMQGYITISTNVEFSKNGGWQPIEFCSRKNLYFLNVEANYPNEQSCWGINHVLREPTSSYAPKYGKNVWQVLSEQGLTMPRLLIDTVFRFANRPSFITYEIYLNPEFYGFPVSGETSWASSPWHKDMVARDPKRQQFLDRIRTQYAAFVPVLRSQFP